METVKGQVERVHFDGQERRELLMLLKVQPGNKMRYLELSVERDIVQGYSRDLRLTAPGDMVQLTLTRSTNGIEGLYRFQNDTVQSLMKYATHA